MDGPLRQDLVLRGSRGSAYQLWSARCLGGDARVPAGGGTTSRTAPSRALVSRRSFTSQHENGRREVAGAPLRRELEAGTIWQLWVEERQIVIHAAGEIPDQGHRVCNIDGQALFAKTAREAVGPSVLILHHQDSHVSIVAAGSHDRPSKHVIDTATFIPGSRSRARVAVR